MSLIAGLARSHLGRTCWPTYIIWCVLGQKRCRNRCRNSDLISAGRNGVSWQNLCRSDLSQERGRKVKKKKSRSHFMYTEESGQIISSILVIVEFIMWEHKVINNNRWTHLSSVESNLLAKITGFTINKPLAHGPIWCVWKPCVTEGFKEHHESSRGFCSAVLSHGQLLGSRSRNKCRLQKEFQSCKIFTQVNKVTTSSQCPLTKVYVHT